MSRMVNINNSIDIIGFFKILTIVIYTYLLANKIMNTKEKDKIQTVKNIFYFIIIAFIYSKFKAKVHFILRAIFLSLFIIILIVKNKHENYVTTTIAVCISLAINEIMFIIASAITYYCIRVLGILNEYIIFLSMVIVYSGSLWIMLRQKRLKNGFSFIRNKSYNEFFEIVLLNISAVILVCIICIINASGLGIGEVGIGIIISSFILFVTIQKSIQLYYKQKLLIQDLNETKKDLEIKTKEVQTLEQENLSYSKKAHSLEHKLKSLENKINKLTFNQEISKEISIDKEIKNISSQMHNKIVYVELDKTGIEEIDDMLDTMKNEAIKNNIEFNLQLKGNIYQMTNNYIDKHDLAILIADHIKDAIIAINHTENVNKSILVRLGKIDNCFALYIYDTGVEFNKEVLDNLGKIPITTYKEEGGTGMGFMNTFDTLNKTKASLTIKQIGPPSKDNYTKVIMIIFDEKHEFKII